MGRFTTEDLLQYLYHETSHAKSAAIAKAIENDWSLAEEFEVMKLGQKQLENITLSPREDVLKNILNHAEKAISQLHPH